MQGRLLVVTIVESPLYWTRVCNSPSQRLILAQQHTAHTDPGQACKYLGNRLPGRLEVTEQDCTAHSSQSSKQEQ